MSQFKGTGMLAERMLSRIRLHFRTVQELVSASVKAIRENPMFGVPQMQNDELGLRRNGSQLGELFEGGIGRNDSLFTKVLNHLR